MRNLTELKRPLLIAHRGSSQRARENTIEAFQFAIEEGVDAVEFDIRRTADGVLIVHHDAMIKGASKALNFQTLKEAQACAAGLNYQIPTLEETLGVCAGRIAVDVELKEAGYEGEVLRTVDDQFDLDDVLFMSFKDESVRRLKELCPQAMVGLLLGAAPRVPIRKRPRKLSAGKRLELTHADLVAPHWSLLRFGFLARMRKRGVPVIVWTVDNKALALTLSNKGVAGIISNGAAELKRIVQA